MSRTTFTTNEATWKNGIAAFRRRRARDFLPGFLFPTAFMRYTFLGGHLALRAVERS